MKARIFSVNAIQGALQFFDDASYGMTEPKLIYTGSEDQAVNRGKDYITTKKENIRHMLNTDSMQFTHPIIQPTSTNLNGYEDSVFVRNGGEIYAFAYSIIPTGNRFSVYIFEKTNSEHESRWIGNIVTKRGNLQDIGTYLKNLKRYKELGKKGQLKLNEQEVGAQ